MGVKISQTDKNKFKIRELEEATEKATVLIAKLMIDNADLQKRISKLESES